MSKDFIPEFKSKKFIVVDGDFDYTTLQRTFTGRMTRLRWKIISDFCRKKSGYQHCGHEWDCCGCMHSQSVSFDYKHNQVTVSISQSFNY